MIDRGRHNVLGVGVNALDYECALEQIIQAAQLERPLGVSALAVHGVMTGALDKTHRHRLNQLELVLPDGQPVRWALNWLYRVGLTERVYGPDLMLETCRQAAEKSIPIYLYGGTESLLSNLREGLLGKFENLEIAGSQPSLFRQLQAEEKHRVVEDIRASGARITFVGLGCPRQEVWAYEFKDSLSMPVLAVGAAFAFHAGQLPQAPGWMQRVGLEWFYRMICEPRRLWKRYVFLNPLFLTMLFAQKTRLRQFKLDDTLPPQKEVLYG